MNIKVSTIGGGIFSKFMVAVQSINDLCDVDLIDNVYIDVDVVNDPIINNNLNPFDFVLEQTADLKFGMMIDCHSNHKDRYKKFGPQVYSDIFNNSDLPNLKKICSKIKIKKTILDRSPIFDDSTLGVHVRLTDMNTNHPIYGQQTIDDYIKKIIGLMNNNDTLNKIFISSDNEESINTIKENKQINKYEIIYNKLGNRHINDKGLGYTNYQIKHMLSESFWVDSFLDMVSLSKCSELIYKVSNLNNTSIIFSNTIKKTHRL